MNGIVLATLVLLLSTPIFASISCYVGTAGTYTSTTGFDVCYKYTVLSVVTKSGAIGVTCSSPPSGYECCATDLCNSAKINGMSIFLAGAMAILAFIRSI